MDDANTNPTTNEHFANGKYINPKLQAAVDEGTASIEKARKSREGIYSHCPKCGTHVLMRWNQVVYALSGLSKQSLDALVYQIDREAGHARPEQNTEQPKAKLL